MQLQSLSAGCRMASYPRCMSTSRLSVHARDRGAIVVHACLLTDAAHLQVLTTGSWPAARSAPCALPMELEQCSHVFNEYYKQKHSGRKLSWHSQVRPGCILLLHCERSSSLWCSKSQSRICNVPCAAALPAPYGCSTECCVSSCHIVSRPAG